MFLNIFYIAKKLSFDHSLIKFVSVVHTFLVLNKYYPLFEGQMETLSQPLLYLTACCNHMGHKFTQLPQNVGNYE